ncbi:MAG: hypothetical protein ACLQVL_28465 [Terriglobia bacterium]
MIHRCFAYGRPYLYLHRVFLTNGQCGFLRGEFSNLDDARHPAWGYAVYPPLAPFLGGMELELFGTSLRGFRFFPAVFPEQPARAVIAAKRNFSRRSATFLLQF